MYKVSRWGGVDTRGGGKWTSSGSFFNFEEKIRKTRYDIWDILNRHFGAPPPSPYIKSWNSPTETPVLIFFEFGNLYIVQKLERNIFYPAQFSLGLAPDLGL